MTKLNRGFTLIELLVVIAIIGILSTIVLASLGTARTKGEDSAIQANLSNMRAQAELLYSNLNSYGVAPATPGTCPTGTSNDIFGTSSVGSLKTLVDGVVTRAGASPANVYCNASSTGWTVAAKLKGTGYACADSTGVSKASSSATALSGSGTAMVSTSGWCN